MAYLNLILQKLVYRTRKTLKNCSETMHSHTLISLKLCPETLHSDFPYRTLPQGYRCSRPRSLTLRLTQTSTCVPYLPTSRRTMPPILTLPPRGDTWTERLATPLKSTYVTVYLVLISCGAILGKMK